MKLPQKNVPQTTLASLARASALLVLVLLAGCAGSSKKGPDGQSVQTDSDALAQTDRLVNDFSRSKLIASDFVTTMARIPSTEPAKTVIQTTRPNNRFGELLLSAFQNAGYDLRIGSVDSEYWLEYTASKNEQLSEIGNPIYTFIVAAGEVKLKRSYEVGEFGVWPAGKMLVHGADASSVVVDDSIFMNSRPKRETKVEQDLVALNEPEPQTLERTESGVVVQAVPTPTPLVGSQKVVARTNSTVLAREEILASVGNAESLDTTQTQVPGNVGSSTESSPYAAFPNMYESGESTYEEIFADYEELKSQVLIFGDDSLILGKANKQAIASVVGNFNPETDLISVIGCSHGASQIGMEDGNGYLANGRAFRVKEEFVMAGLAEENVLEEGCWAGMHFVEMPARGVVVEHKRLIN